MPPPNASSPLPYLQAGSVSDLSQLSLDTRPPSPSRPTAMRRPLAAPQSLILQEASDPEGILDRCIQAALPKVTGTSI